MKREMLMENEMMSEMELDQVNGGTLEEVYELTTAICNKGGTFGKVIGYAARVLKDTGTSRLGGPLNIALRNEVSEYLSKFLDVKNNLSVGFLGTGVAADPNTYSKLDSKLSHQWVLAMLGAREYPPTTN